MKLYNEKRSDLEEQQLHLNVGLQKIKETVDQVCIVHNLYCVPLMPPLTKYIVPTKALGLFYLFILLGRRTTEKFINEKPGTGGEKRIS